MADDVTEQLHSFHLFDPKDPKRKQYYIFADNALDLKAWIKTIEACIFHLLLFFFIFFFSQQLQNNLMCQVFLTLPPLFLLISIFCFSCYHAFFGLLVKYINLYIDARLKQK